MNDSQKKLMIEASHFLAQAADRLMGVATVETVEETDCANNADQYPEFVQNLEKEVFAGRDMRDALEEAYRLGMREFAEKDQAAKIDARSLNRSGSLIPPSVHRWARDRYGLTGD